MEQTYENIDYIFLELDSIISNIRKYIHLKEIILESGKMKINFWHMFYGLLSGQILVETNKLIDNNSNNLSIEYLLNEILYNTQKNQSSLFSYTDIEKDFNEWKIFKKNSNYRSIGTEKFMNLVKKSTYNQDV